MGGNGRRGLLAARGPYGLNDAQGWDWGGGEVRGADVGGGGGGVNI